MQQIIRTEDGSDTLYSDVAGQTYHSTHGAIQESRWIFIDRGLKYFVERREHRPVSVLEIGFGTGLNALLAERFSAENDVGVEFSTIELFPLDREILSRLNYGQETAASEIFDKIHTAEWSGQLVPVTERFTIRKFRSEIVETVRRMSASQEWREHFDVIMFDAFSPDAQPDLWQPEIFENLHIVTASGGVLTTYCAKGSVRRAMQAARFDVERLPGPPGKREILRGTKHNNRI